MSRRTKWSRLCDFLISREKRKDVYLELHLTVGIGCDWISRRGLLLRVSSKSNEIAVGEIKDVETNTIFSSPQE